MRTALLVMTSLFLFTGCAEDNYYGGHGDDHYGGGGYGGYGGGGYGGYNDYGNYYPYGNPNYPRNNIYYIDGYHPCHGYPYQGYCYKDKDDVQAAMYWDRQHGYDDNWHKKRKDWCNKHDCRRDHDTRDDDDHGGSYYDHDGRHGTTDANGRPVTPRTERDRAETVDPRLFHGRDTNPAAGHPSQGSIGRPDVDTDRGQPRYHQPRAETVQPSVNQPSVSQPRFEPAQPHVRQPRAEPDQPYVQRPQRAEPVYNSRPTTSGSAGQSSQERQPQRSRAGRAVDTSATPE